MFARGFFICAKRASPAAALAQWLCQKFPVGNARQNPELKKPFIFNGFAPSARLASLQLNGVSLEPKQSTKQKNERTNYETDSIRQIGPGVADLRPAGELAG
jgi:hypothetical protein